METARHRGGSSVGRWPDDVLVAPRRAVPSVTGRWGRGRLVRLIVAPVALLSVGGLAVAAVVVPPGGGPLQLTDPGYAAVDTGVVSRNYSRPSLAPAPTASAMASPSPSASASASPTTTAAAPSPPSSSSPAPSATRPVDYLARADAAGTRYTTASVNVRTGPGLGYAVRATLSDGAEVAITGWAVDGWRQVVVSRKAGWIKESYLTTKKPVAAPARESQSASSGGSGFSDEPCADASGIESGLTSRTRSVLRAVCAEFPQVDSYGGYRADGGSYHSTGRAIDVMATGEFGWEIARWARANASALGIIEVIYSQRIWTSQRSGDGWRAMEDRGGTTANHYDHVHISVR